MINADDVSSNTWISRHEVMQPKVVDDLEVSTLEAGRTHLLALTLLENAAARPIRLPLLVARGSTAGPTFGVTAAIHGNEVNGIRVIQALFEHIDPKKLRGTLIGAPIVNLPAYIRYQREYPDGQDLNRIMPGRANGNEAQLYAHLLMQRLIGHFDYLVDLHTASFGRVNSLYVRADMSNELTAMMARQIGAEIIVHNPGGDGTLRAAAAAAGVHAITVEVGDPQVIERPLVRKSRIGLRDLLEDLNMVDPDGERNEHAAIECGRSYWLYTDTGGILRLRVALRQELSAGDEIARLIDPWGQLLRTYTAPEPAIVVGMATNPVARAGARIVHLGVIAQPR
ncbi:MAG: succinylglutamate desuccinylase/aspartoacylase family protein [Deltaproteobacteria bacterium]|nr:succinylglutamate desuccinylase/aspartoacylase family protein [Deltaproteobacteria bacterium]